MRFSLVYLLIIFGFKRIFQIKEGSTLVCSAHFKPEDMYVTIVPSQFAWTKAGKERRQNKLQAEEE